MIHFLYGGIIITLRLSKLDPPILFWSSFLGDYVYVYVFWNKKIPVCLAMPVPVIFFPTHFEIQPIKVEAVELTCDVTKWSEGAKN